jgi:hypothetical protein
MNDSDYNDSDYDDSDYDDSDYNDSDYYEEYDPEESSNTRFNIVISQQNKVRRINLVHFRLKQFDYNRIHVIYDNYMSKCTIEIAECVYLPSGHCIGILKTFWVRIIQRAWKKVFMQRKMCIQRRAHPSAIRYREIYGKWPHDCSVLPGLVGLTTASSGAAF